MDGLPNSIILLFISLFLLPGCGLLKKDITVTAEIEEPIFIHPAPASSMIMKEVEWTVMNPDRIKELAKSLGPDDKVALFVLSAQGYENLSMNMAEIMRFIKDQQAIILYYKEAVAPEVDAK